jgi:hypothetical protein
VGIKAVLSLADRHLWFALARFAIFSTHVRQEAVLVICVGVIHPWVNFFDIELRLALRHYSLL